MLVVMAVTLYTSRVILKALGVEDYGIYDVVGGIVTTMAFLNGALGASTSRFLTFELGKGDCVRLKKTFSASLSLHICVAFLVLIIGETLGLWFFYEKMVIPMERLNAAFWVYQFSIITTMVTFTQVPYNASIIAHENMSIYAYVGLYEAFSKLFIVYLIFISPIDKLVFYALLLMLNSCAIQFYYRFYTLRHYEECHFHFSLDRNLYKTLLNYSGWDLFGQTALICQGQGINIVLNLFFGPVVNAARAIAVQMQMGAMMLVNNFLMAVRPQVVKSFADNKTERMFSLTFVSAKFAYLLMLAVVLPLCFEMDFILRVWLGDNVPEFTNIFSIIVLITYLMETYHIASLMSYHAIGKIKLGNIVGGTIMILALPFSYISLKMGAPACSVFIVIFCTNFTQMFWGWMIVHRYVSFSYTRLIKEVYLPTIIITLLAVIVPLIIHSLYNEGWLRFTLLLLSTEVFLLILTYYIALSKEERVKVVSFVKTKLIAK
jgi:O-antigen/teichoic acid export membrane protein